MRAWALMLVGIGLLAASLLGVVLRVGEVPLVLALPDTPATRPLARALNDLVGTPGPPQAATGMRLRIPSIGVDAAVDELGLDGAGQMEAPSRWEDVGWFKQGPAPGQPGIAIVAGHVDSYVGPAVFARLGELKEGEPAWLDQDGRTLEFRAGERERYPAASFPLDRLFVSSGPPRLALLTCAGAFDRAHGAYRDRMVVFASQVTT